MNRRYFAACLIMILSVSSLIGCNRAPKPEQPTTGTASENSTTKAPEQTTAAPVEETTPVPETEPVIPKPVEDACYSITISINPLVKLFMDANDRVLEVKCLNADSETAYGDIMDDLIGKPAASATETIVISAIEQGYLKEGASCKISCEEVWEASETIVEQFAQIQQTVQTVLIQENREDAFVRMEIAQAVEVIEEAGIQIKEDLKEELAVADPEEEETVVIEPDDAYWPNILFVMKPGELVEEVIYLNDSANRAYAGVTKDVVNMSDREATKVYLAAAYENGYLKEQLDYDAGPNIPRWILEKLMICCNYDEAILNGIIPIPHEFYTKCPRVALIIGDDQNIKEVVYLNETAKTELADLNLVGMSDGKGAEKVVARCYLRGYIRFMNIPLDMFNYMITICNEEEATQLGIK